MSQLSKVYCYLERQTSKNSPGVTVAHISDRTRVPKSSVYRRVSELRQLGHNIYSNYRTINGDRKLYYRLNGTNTGDTPVSTLA